MKCRVSVAMATYNGEKYIKEQIESILEDINEKDEIIVSDDGSTDKTRTIINSFKDNRIKIVDGPKNGVKKNFENAIRNCSGEYIFLCDQDDVWDKNKVKKVLKIFEDKRINVVVHDATIVDSDLNEISDSFYSFKNSGKGIIKNIYRNTYIGCCMAFRSTIVDKVLPIPNSIEMHDQWIGILSEVYGKACFIPDKLLKYRRHGNNVSEMKHYGIFKMLRNRIVFIIKLIGRLFRKGGK